MRSAARRETTAAGWSTARALAGGGGCAGYLCGESSLNPPLLARFSAVRSRIRFIFAQGSHNIPMLREGQQRCYGAETAASCPARRSALRSKTLTIHAPFRQRFSSRKTTTGGPQKDAFITGERGPA